MFRTVMHVVEYRVLRDYNQQTSKFLQQMRWGGRKDFHLSPNLNVHQIQIFSQRTRCHSEAIFHSRTMFPSVLDFHGYRAGEKFQLSVGRVDTVQFQAKIQRMSSTCHSSSHFFLDAKDSKGLLELGGGRGDEPTGSKDYSCVIA